MTRLFLPGHHPLRQQPRLPLDVRVADAAQDLAAQTHAGRDHQAHVREAPDDPGHVGAVEEPGRGAHCVPPRDQGQCVGGAVWVSGRGESG